jgi:hypothetical protein
MSDDLVKRLRDAADSGGYDIYGLHCDLEFEAADCIEKFRAANLQQSLITVDHLARIEKLEAALRVIVDIHPFKDPEGDVSIKSLVDLVFSINMTARKALEWKDD